jgi:hypothetical protein
MADGHERRRPSVLPVLIVLGFVVVVLLLWATFADAGIPRHVQR